MPNFAWLYYLGGHSKLLRSVVCSCQMVQKFCKLEEYENSSDLKCGLANSNLKSANYTNVS